VYQHKFVFLLLVLQPVPEFVSKIIQIFDCKVARHGNMMVGRTGSGKSEAWKCLQRTLGKLKKEHPEDERFQTVRTTAQQGLPSYAQATFPLLLVPFCMPSCCKNAAPGTVRLKEKRLRGWLPACACLQAAETCPRNEKHLHNACTWCLYRCMFTPSTLLH